MGSIVASYALSNRSAPGRTFRCRALRCLSAAVGDVEPLSNKLFVLIHAAVALVKLDGFAGLVVVVAVFGCNVVLVQPFVYEGGFAATRSSL